MKNQEIKEKDCAPVPKEEGSWFCEVEDITNIKSDETVDEKIRRLITSIGPRYKDIESAREHLRLLEELQQIQLDDLNQTIINEHAVTRKLSPFEPIMVDSNFGRKFFVL